MRKSLRQGLSWLCKEEPRGRDFSLLRIGDGALRASSFGLTTQARQQRRGEPSTAGRHGPRSAGTSCACQPRQQTWREHFPEVWVPSYVGHAVTTRACLDGNSSQSTKATSKRAGTSPNK